MEINFEADKEFSEELNTDSKVKIKAKKLFVKYAKIIFKEVELEHSEEKKLAKRLAIEEATVRSKYGEVKYFNEVIKEIEKL